MAIFYPSGTGYIPVDAWAQTTNLYGLDAYAYGPLITGVPLLSGDFFSGRWASYFKEDHVQINRLTSINDTASASFTGYELDWFGGTFSTNSTARFTNFSLSFNNSGLPLVAYQDNGDSIVGFTNKPYVNVWQLSGSTPISSGWLGEAPGLMNSLIIDQIGAKGSGNRYQRYQTGQNLCFYQLNDALYYRFQSGFEWSSGILISNDLTSGYRGRTKIEILEYSLEKPYSPYRFAILNQNAGGTSLRMIGSTYLIQCGWDDFKRYATGELLTEYGIRPLASGYGAIVSDYIYGPKKTHVFSNDDYYFDSFNLYSTGLQTGLNGTGLFFKDGYSTGFATGLTYSNENYFASDFNLYSTGFYSGYGVTGNLTGFSSGLSPLDKIIRKLNYDQFTGVTSGYSIWSGYLGVM
jgi:hypothetical protein